MSWPTMEQNIKVMCLSNNRLLCAGYSKYLSRVYINEANTLLLKPKKVLELKSHFEGNYYLAFNKQDTHVALVGRTTEEGKEVGHCIAPCIDEDLCIQKNESCSDYYFRKKLICKRLSDQLVEHHDGFYVEDKQEWQQVIDATYAACNLKKERIC